MLSGDPSRGAHWRSEIIWARAREMFLLRINTKAMLSRPWKRIKNTGEAKEYKKGSFNRKKVSSLAKCEE